MNLEIIFFQQENYFEPSTSFLHEVDCFSVKKTDTKIGYKKGADLKKNIFVLLRF